MKNKMTIQTAKSLLTAFLIFHIEQVEWDVTNGYNSFCTNDPKLSQKENVVMACKQAHYGKATAQQLGYEYITMWQEVRHDDAIDEPDEQSVWITTMTNMELYRSFADLIANYDTLNELIMFTANELQRLLNMYVSGMALNQE